MSSYIRRLAERSLGVQPSVNPRLPGRYEPAELPGFDGLEPESIELVEVPEEDRSGPAVRQVPTLSRDIPIPPAKPPGVEPSRRPVEPAAEPGHIPAESGEVPSMKHGQQREVKPAEDFAAYPGSRKQAPNQNVDVRIKPISAERPNLPVEQSSVATGPREEGTASRPDAWEINTLRTEAPRPKSHRTSPSAVREGPEISDRDETGNPVRPSVQPITPNATWETPAKAEAEHAAPTIHVAIGRIEVRATPAPEKSKRRQPTQMVMSLDEYMRQRREGGRG